jgi:hypothetical protein
MKKENLETKIIKQTVLKIKDTVDYMSNVIRDVSSKLCYLIKKYKDDYRLPEKDKYYSGL